MNESFSGKRSTEKIDYRSWSTRDQSLKVSQSVKVVLIDQINFIRIEHKRSDSREQNLISVKAFCVYARERIGIMITC